MCGACVKGNLKQQILSLQSERRPEDVKILNNGVDITPPKNRLCSLFGIKL